MGSWKISPMENNKEQIIYSINYETNHCLKICKTNKFDYCLQVFCGLKNQKLKNKNFKYL